MDTSRQLPTHGDGLLDMREPARTLLESMVNEVMDAQADMPCGNGANARNGYRERGLATPVGDITPRMPKLRAGAYFPEGIIERYSRANRAVAAAVAESWANGVSTRKMERIARKMGMERLSRDRVSAMSGSLDAEVGELASRDLGGIEVPCLLLDAAYVKCGRDGRVRSTAVTTESPPFPLTLVLPFRHDVPNGGRGQIWDAHPPSTPPSSSGGRRGSTASAGARTRSSPASRAATRVIWLY